MDCSVDSVTCGAFWIAIGLALIALIGYLYAGFSAIFLSMLKHGEKAKNAFMKNPAANVGIPCSAFAAYALVATLWAVFPPSSDKELTISWFGLTFTGPSGPITLWVLCFVAFVMAIKTLKLGK